MDGELVDDRSLEATDADSFHHADFANELAGIICRTKTPANIALFGPWGSGKSGIANLLRQALPKDKRKVRFVVFDASKYAEAPLRRHFISQVAYGLDIEKEDYHGGLYAAVEDRDVRFRPGEWLPLAGAFLVAVLLSVAVLLVIVTVVALASGSFSKNWSRDVKDYLLAALPIAALITVFVKLMADGFHVRTNRDAPAGDEEFESRFKSLVAEAKTERLVVFIDELDRCSPAQVASVLETLKTFLFVEHCVFVVAADQQVLEQALRKKIRQHTPEDSSNPYYSAGSSYLDKVFQYQLTLPPLRSPTLSRFALSLVEGHPGIWGQIDGLDEVVSVLIPTHVVSPRRVKVLLNRFATAYRLALTRAAEGRLDPNVGSRATELAKLVCLQAEFPLFAEDLTLDARLPELVRMVAEGEPLPASVAPDVAARAIAYAQGRRVVAELLVDEPRSDEAPRRRPDGEDGDAEAQAAQAPEQEGDEAESDEVENNTTESGEVTETAQSRAEEVARRQAQQLVAYLRKTQLVPGPQPDLLYLESAGAGHGIDTVLADRLQRAALDNDTAEVLRLVASASGENQGLGALLVLADVVGQAQPGVEGRNAVSVLLQSIQRSGVELSSQADYVADAVAAHLAQADLQPADLLGALALARGSSRAVAKELLEAVLRHPGVAQRADVAVALVDHTSDVPGPLRGTLVTAAETALLQAPDEVAQHLLKLPTNDVRRLLRDLAAPLKTTSDAHYEAVAAQERGEALEEEALREPPPEWALVTAFDEVVADDENLTGRSRELALELVRLMLTLDHLEYRSAVAERLHYLTPVTDKDLIARILAAVRRRVTAEWPSWLDPLDLDVISGDDELKQAVDSAAASLWTKLVADEPPTEEETEEAIAALARCAANLDDRKKLNTGVREVLAAPYNSDELVTSQSLAVESAARLVNASILDRATLADAELAGAAQTLRSDAPTGSPPQPQPGVPGPPVQQPAPSSAEVPGAILSRVRTAAGLGSQEALRDVIAAAAEGRWLSEAARADVQLLAASGAKANDPEIESPLTVEQLHAIVPELAGGERETVDEAFSLALTHFTDGPEGAWVLVEPLVEGELPPQTRSALSAFAQRLSGPARFTLIEQALQRVITHPVDRTFFEASRLSEVPAERVTERLGELFAQAHDETGWRGVLNVWQQLGPTSEAAQQRLVDEVYLPLIEKGATGLDLALQYFALVSAVRGIRPRVTAALEKGAQTEEQQRRVDERLLESRWRRKSLFGLGPSVDQDE